MKRIEAVPRTHKRRHIPRGMKQRAKDRIKPVIENGSEGQNRQ
jgi:hypothetical protein